jgi:hypothetical protein
VLLTAVYGVLVIGAVCLAALVELVQRLVPAASRQPHNDVAGFIYAARRSTIAYCGITTGLDGREPLSAIR